MMLTLLLMSGFPTGVGSAKPSSEKVVEKTPDHPPFVSHHLFKSWHRTWDRGAPAAVRANRALMVLAVQDGCSECNRTVETLESLSGKRGLFPGRECLLLDVGGSAVALNTAQQMGITRTPTLVVYRPSEGQLVEVGRKSGSLSARDVARLDRLSGRRPARPSEQDQSTTSSHRNKP